MKNSYSVTPLVPVWRETEKNELWVEPIPPLLFWDWLALPIRDQIKVLAFRYLSKIGAIANHPVISRSIDYETLEIDRMYGMIASHVTEYISVFGEEPALILMGRDIHRKLLQSPEITWAVHIVYQRDGQMQIAGVRAAIFPHMEGFVLVPKRVFGGFEQCHEH
jgi:hypothetical protein